jgi:hypothetical protein
MRQMVTVTQNDKGFDFPFQIVDRNKRPVNITNTVIKFIMRKRNASQAKINAQCMITDGPEGKCKYGVLEGDLDTPGIYGAELEITFGPDKRLTANVSDDIIIVEELG